MDDVGDKNEIKVDFKENFKRILFKHYYKIIAKTENGVKAVCRTCKIIRYSENIRERNTFGKHLQVNDIAYGFKRMRLDYIEDN